MSETPAEHAVTYGDVVTAAKQAQQRPSIGRIVHYRLSDSDVERIVETRMSGDGRGNTVHAGDVVPAIIVRVFEESEGDPDVVGVYVACDLQIFLDGDHTLWGVSTREGDREGFWSWPSRS